MGAARPPRGGAPAPAAAPPPRARRPPGGGGGGCGGLSLGLANTCYVVLVCAGGVLLMTNETLQARYTIKDVAPRLVVGLVASNTSLVLVSVGIDLANALSRALLGPGVDPTQARATLKAVLVVPLDDADVVLTLVALVVVVLALILGASYVLRVAVLVGLTVAGPLALAGHALPQTEALARWWWRADHRLSGHPGRPIAGPDHGAAGVLPRRPRSGAGARFGPAGGSAGGDLPAVVVGPHPHLGGPHGLCRPARHGDDRRQVLCRLPAGAPRPAPAPAMTPTRADPEGGVVRIPADLDRP